MLNRNVVFADYRGTSRVGRALWSGGAKVDGVRDVHGEEHGLADCSRVLARRLDRLRIQSATKCI